MSEWAKANFADVVAKNAFYLSVGQSLKVENEDKLGGLGADSSVEDVMNVVGS